MLTLSRSLERGTPLTEVLRAQAADVREAGKRRLLEAGGRKESAMMVAVVFRHCSRIVTPDGLNAEAIPQRNVSRPQNLSGGLPTTAQADGSCASWTPGRDASSLA